MLAADKDSPVYKLMKTRCNDLKAFLTSSGVNLTDFDSVKG